LSGLFRGDSGIGRRESPQLGDQRRDCDREVDRGDLLGVGVSVAGLNVQKGQAPNGRRAGHRVTLRKVSKDDRGMAEGRP
jgi:hypothetical protein